MDIETLETGSTKVTTVVTGTGTTKPGIGMPHLTGMMMHTINSINLHLFYKGILKEVNIVEEKVTNTDKTVQKKSKAGVEIIQSPI